MSEIQELIDEVEEIRERLKAFKGHKGRPGKKGGSLPKGQGNASVRRPNPPTVAKSGYNYYEDDGYKFKKAFEDLYDSLEFSSGGRGIGPGSSRESEVSPEIERNMIYGAIQDAWAKAGGKGRVPGELSRWARDVHKGNADWPRNYDMTPSKPNPPTVAKPFLRKDVDTTQYEYNRGKKPKGRGQWMFALHVYGAKPEQFSVNADYTTAKAKAFAKAREIGASHVEVLP